MEGQRTKRTAHSINCGIAVVGKAGRNFSPIFCSRLQHASTITSRLGSAPGGGEVVEVLSAIQRDFRKPGPISEYPADCGTYPPFWQFRSYQTRFSFITLDLPAFPGQPSWMRDSTLICKSECGSCIEANSRFGECPQYCTYVVQIYSVFINQLTQAHTHSH